MVTPGLEGFLELPLEVLSIILGALGAKDLLRCGETCRDLHSIVSNVPSLQYTVALTAYGLVDNELSAKPILEKLERARLTYRAHRDFSWIPHHVIQLENQYIEQPTSPLVLRDATNTTAISLLLSGSIVRDAPDRDWTVHPQPTTAFSRSFNASEDLLVLQTQNAPSSSFHLRTMSDGGAHPEAVLPSLAGGALGVGHLTFGPYLLASGANGVHSLWNWKMGVILTTIRCHYSAIAFLDANHIAFVCMSDVGQSIHIYRLPFTIFDAAAEIMHPPHYAFSLPTLAPVAVPLACTMSRGPASSYVPTGSTAPAGDCYTDSEDVLLTINYEQVSPRLQYAIVICLRSLLKLLTPARLGQDTPWEEWGPRHAHAFSLSRRRSTGWDNYSTFGMRRIETYPTLRSDGVLVATIRDYHRCRVALARREIPAEDGRWVINEGEAVAGAWIGMDTLETFLPFVQTTVPLPAELQFQRDSAIILSINDDGIIASTAFIASSAATVHVYTI